MEENPKERPPYLCLKVPNKLIIRYKKDVSIIDDAVQRTHRIVIKAYQLVRLWSLKKIEEAEGSSIKQ